MRRQTHETSGTTERLRVVSICLDSASLSTLQDVLAQIPDSGFTGNLSPYLGRKGDLDLIRRITHPPPDVIVLDFDQDRERAAATAEQMLEVLQGKAAVFAVSSKTDSELIIHAMRSGCSEYLNKPLAPERLAQALAKVESKLRERVRLQKTGKVITLLGAKGGSGVTALAVHLAVFLSSLGKGKTLLIDYHARLGVVALYLGIDKHPYDFYELVNSAARLDVNLVRGFVVSHPSGLDVLASPSTFDVGKGISQKDTEYTLDFLKTIYDFIVLDCAPGLTDANVTPAQQADELFLVATPDVPSIRNLSRYLEHLGRFNRPVEDVKVVINRHSKKGDISKDHIERALKKKIHLTMPNSYAEVIEAANSGTPIPMEKGSEFARAMKHWAESLVQDAEMQAARQESDKPSGIFRLVGFKES